MINQLQLKSFNHFSAFYFVFCSSFVSMSYTTSPTLFHPYVHVVNDVDVPLQIYVMVTKCDVASLVVMILINFI